MSLLFHAVWLLCGIGAAVFAATAIRGRWSAPIALAGFALGAVASRPQPPEASWMGVLAALVAVMGLAWPRHWILTSATAGLLAGIWSSLLQRQGLPAVAAWTAAASVPILAAWCAWRRPDFLSPVLRDEALILTLVFAVAVAISPGVLEGWRAALQLNMPAELPRPSIPAWALLLGGASLAAGAGAAAWERR